MRYCLRNMIYGLRRMIYLLRKHDIISVPIIREAYIIRVSGFHRVSDLIRDQRERISLKKALAFASAFFWWGRTDSFAFSFPFGNENRGVATVEPVSSDSPLDCRIWDLRIHPPAFQTHKKTNPKRIGLFLVGEDGFEPSKRNAADLQSVPFGHSGTPPDMRLCR